MQIYALLVDIALFPQTYQWPLTYLYTLILKFWKSMMYFCLHKRVEKVFGPSSRHTANSLEFTCKRLRLCKPLAPVGSHWKCNPGQIIYTKHGIIIEKPLETMLATLFLKIIVNHLAINLLYCSLAGTRMKRNQKYSSKHIPQIKIKLPSYEISFL